MEELEITLYIWRDWAEVLGDAVGKMRGSKGGSYCYIAL